MVHYGLCENVEFGKLCLKTNQYFIKKCVNTAFSVCCIYNYIPHLILREIEKENLLTIVCYDSILNKFTVLYCKGFVTYMAKMFSSFLRKKKGFPSVGQDRPTLPNQIDNQNTEFISSYPVGHDAH